jgi:hypothetical protein
MWDGAMAADAAYEAARTWVAELESVGSAEALALKAEVEVLAPAPRPSTGGRFRSPASAGPPNLQGVSQAMMNAAMAMQAADVAPTERQISACEAAKAQYQEVMARWEALRAG